MQIPGFFEVSLVPNSPDKGFLRTVVNVNSVEAIITSPDTDDRCVLVMNRQGEFAEMEINDTFDEVTQRLQEAIRTCR